MSNLWRGLLWNMVLHDSIHLCVVLSGLGIRVIRTIYVPVSTFSCLSSGTLKGCHYFDRYRQVYLLVSLHGSEGFHFLLISERKETWDKQANTRTQRMVMFPSVVQLLTFRIQQAKAKQS
jgi:hypothetical protein